MTIDEGDVPAGAGRALRALADGADVSALRAETDRLTAALRDQAD